MTEKPTNFSGMTVNERLFAAGIIAAWDLAIQRRDSDAMRELLERVGSSDQADSIIKAALR